MDERKLIERCLARDHQAWNEFTKLYYRLVLKCVRYKLKNTFRAYSRSLAEDITQEVFMNLWETDKLSDVRDLASIKGWLAVVSINFTTSALRRKKYDNERKTLSLDGLLDAEKNFSTLYDISKEHCSPMLSFTSPPQETHSEENDLLVIIKREISKLVPKQALALKLNLLQGLAQKDIAELMKIPENTVATLIRRGKYRLSKRLKILLEK